MADTIVIVGGLENDASRDDLLSRLRTREPSVEWEWIQVAGDACDLPSGEANKYFGRLATLVADAKKAGHRVRFVKLFRLHNRLQHRLYGLTKDPVLAPKEIGTVADLVEWLLAPEAGLVPPRMWQVNEGEAALLAILSKLLRNKSWNKDGHGHAWTKETDLLTQSPVDRPGYNGIRQCALRILNRLKGTVLLYKGGSNTPAEWSINTSFLPTIKKMIQTCSFDELSVEEEVVRSLTRDATRPYQALGEIVSEKVMGICSETVR